MATDYADALQERLEQIHEFIRPHLKLQSDRMKERYDLKQLVKLLEVGEAMWLYNPERKDCHPCLTVQGKGPILSPKQLKFGILHPSTIIEASIIQLSVLLLRN